MNYKKNKEELNALLEQVKELLKGLPSEDFYFTWADTFRIEKITKKCVVIGYYGKAPLRRFKKECSEILWAKTCSLVGYRDDVKVHKCKPPKAEKKEGRQRNETVKTVKAKKNIKAIKFLALGLVFACIAVSIGVVLCNYVENRTFRETFYNVSSLKVDNPVRVIQLSDLHNTSYGENNADLIGRVRKLDPDVIICTGDILESSDPNTSGIEHLGTELSKVAPLYYIYGNNEVETVYDFPLNEKELDEKFGFTDGVRDETKLPQYPDALEVTLEKAGFKVLKNEKDTVTVGTTKLDVYGVLNSNPSSFWTYTANSFSSYLYEDANNLKITAVHEPFIFEEFTPEYWGDLMLCGHTHGGEVRVPMIGPLYTREGGLFPERNGDYVYGRFDVAGRPLIVSAGLDNNSLWRINNQPELVVIDINKF